MKRSLIILFIVLGTIVEANAFLSSKTKAILTNDKSKVFVVYSTTEIVKTSIDGKKTIEDIRKTWDTIETYFVTDEAKKYITDTLVSKLFQGGSHGTVSLPDSLLARFTHLFGEETYFSRELRIVDNGILFCFVGTEKHGPALFKRIGWILLLFYSACIYLFVYRIMKDNSKGLAKFTAFLLFLVTLFIGLFAWRLLFNITYLDVIILSFFTNIPAFLLVFIKFKKKNRPIIYVC